MMKIRNTEDAKSRWLEIECEAESLERHEVQMLLSNRIDRLLPLRIEQADGWLLCRYEITGLQSLKDCAQDRLSGSYVQALIFALEQAAEALNDYLLDADSLLLEPETIFFRSETGSVYFCYVPGVRKPVRASLQSLMEYLLKLLQPEREEDVLLLYGLYRKSRELNVTLSSLAAYWRAEREEEDEFENGSGAVDPEEERSPVYDELGLDIAKEEPGREDRYRGAGLESPYDAEAAFGETEEREEAEEEMEDGSVWKQTAASFIKQHWFEFAVAAAAAAALLLIFLL